MNKSCYELDFLEETFDLYGSWGDDDLGGWSDV